MMYSLLAATSIALFSNFAFSAETVTLSRNVSTTVITVKGGETGTAEKIYRTLDQANFDTLPTRDGKQITGKSIEASVTRAPNVGYSVDLKVDPATSKLDIKQEFTSVKISLSGEIAEELFKALAKSNPSQSTSPYEISIQSPELSCTSATTNNTTYSCLVQVNAGS